MKPVTGKFSYQDESGKYETDICIDLENYATFFSSSSDAPMCRGSRRRRWRSCGKGWSVWGRFDVIQLKLAGIKQTANGQELALALLFLL